MTAKVQQLKLNNGLKKDVKKTKIPADEEEEGEGGMIFEKLWKEVDRGIFVFQKGRYGRPRMGFE